MFKKNIQGLRQNILLGVMYGTIISSYFYEYQDQKLAEQKIEAQKKFEADYSYTWIGRRESSKETPYILASFNYQNHYYITNSSLERFGSNSQFELVFDERYRGIKNQVMSYDILPFKTISDTNEIKSLEEAYDILDSYCEKNGSPFPIVQKQEQNYFIDDIYVVFKNNKLYLCRENLFQQFEVLSDTNYPGVIFNFNPNGYDTISPHQVVKFTNLLALISHYSPNSDEMITLEKGYQMLSEIFAEKDFSIFERKKSSVLNGFSKSELQMADFNCFMGYPYLDAYHLEYFEVPRMYWSQDVFVVKLDKYPQISSLDEYDNNLYLLASNVTYDRENDYYQIVPLQVSYESLTPIIVNRTESIQVMDAKDIFDYFSTFSYQQTALVFYDYFNAYLLRYGNPFEISAFLQKGQEIISYRNHFSNSLEKGIQQFHYDMYQISDWIESYKLSKDCTLLRKKNDL